MPGNPLAAFGAAPPQPRNPAGQPQQQGNTLSSQPTGTKNPLNAFGNKTASPTSPAPSASPTGQLPEGAVGMTPGGEPYFGEGLSGILKQWKYNYTKDIKPVDQQDWTDLKSRWDNLLSPHGGRTAAQMQGQSEAQMGQQDLQQGLSIAGEAISKGFQQGESQGSPLSPILKGLSASVTAIGDLFSIPAKKLEQTVGALAGAREASQELQSPLPRLDDNEFTKGLEALPIGMAYDFARIALSPSDNKWDYTAQKIEDGWNAGRILYSQAFDATKKEEYLQAYRMGEDPGLIALKLQNPYAELGGQILLDPLNLVGAFARGAKTAKEIDMAHAAVAEQGLLDIEKGAQAFKDVTNAQDDASAIKALNTLQEARLEQVVGVESKSKLLNTRYGIGDLTTSSRTNALVGKGKELLGNMALVLKESGMSYDGIAEAIVYGAKSVSRDAEEMKAGLAGISHLPNAHMWLTNDYAESFNVVYKLLRGEGGTLDGVKLAGLMKVSNPAEFADEAVKLMKAATLQALPDVNELEQAAKLSAEAAKTGGAISARTTQMAETYARLPEHVKILNTIDQAFSKAIKNPINSLLSPLYFNLQGGVAVKNIIANNELILIDKGIGAWFRDGKYWTHEENLQMLKDVFGELPESAHGFKSLVSASTGKEPFLFGKWMEVGEEKGAARVVAASVRDTFKTMIPKAFPSLAKDIEAGTITQKQADKLLSLLIKHNGNTERATADFRDLYKTGAVEAWRNLDYVSDYEKSGLEGMGYWKEIEDLAQRGATTPEEVNGVIDKLVSSIDNRSKEATKDVVGMAQDHPNAETWADLMKAVDEGHLNPGDHQVFTAIMESAEQARLEYQTLLDNVAQKAMGELSQTGKLEEAQHIGEEMNRVRDVLRKGAPLTAKQTHDITQDAWRWNDAIKAEKKPDIATLKSYWTKMGLNGEPPLDLTKKTLQQELWKQRFEKVTQTWNSSFDAIFAESETVLKQMDGVVDTGELQDMAKTARNMTAQAQSYRTAVFDGKALRIQTPNDVYKMARDYGVATATETGQKVNRHVVNAVNKYLEKDYKKLEDIPVDEIRQAFEKRKVAKAAEATAAPKAVQTAQNAVYIAQPKTVAGKTGFTYEQVYGNAVVGSANRGSIIDEPGRAVSSGAFSGYIGGSNAEIMLKDGSTVSAPSATGGQFLTIPPGATKSELVDQNIVTAFRNNPQAEWIPTEFYKGQTGTQVTQAAKAAGSGQAAEDVSGLPTNLFDSAGNPIEQASSSIAVPPPHPIGSQPSIARAWNESSKGAKYVLENIRTQILNQWGKTDQAMSASPQMDAMLERVASEFNPKMAEIRPTALKVAERQREFTLLNYGKKTYGDVALSYIMPYHFFYTRSYKNWISRIATNPEIVAGYGKYKNQLEEINKDLPDWYKQQLNINLLADNPAMKGKTLLGIPLDHPLYINLESSINPLYGLTGTDFNDPVKRTNWATATMDDLGKFGPTLWAPLQMGIAAKLYMDGNTDAASRWGNRLIPETAQVKAVTSMFGKPVELDPAVQFFSGGIDPYERGRMGYAAAQLIQEGKYTPEQVQEQFQQQSGPAWDESYQMAVQSRAASSVSSYFLGVGFKPRSTNDVQVEQMMTDVNKLYASADMMSGDQYKQAWEQLRSQYPDGMLDTVLLAKKGGDKRDAAYAYQVLGRLPPGEMSGVFKAIGISAQDVSKFYDSKGFTDPKVSFTPTEKQRFMAAVVDLGAMLKIPDSATRQEWTNARSAYSDAQEQIKKQLGEDIWDKVSLYYDLKNDDKQAADNFKNQHPEVQMALQMKGEAVANSPILSAYYGGIDNIEAYLSGKTRQTLEDKYGKDIYDIQQGYFNATNPRAYLAGHSQLKKFWSDKKMLDQQSEKMFLQFGAHLPQMQGAQFRPDFQPTSGVQQTLYQQLQPKNPVPDWQTVSDGMPEWLQSEVIAYAQTQKPVSKRAQTELDYLAGQGGYYDYKDLLRTAALSLRTGGTSPQTVTNPSGALAAFGH